MKLNILSPRAYDSTVNQHMIKTTLYLDTQTDESNERREKKPQIYAAICSDRFNTREYSYASVRELLVRRARTAVNNKSTTYLTRTRASSFLENYPYIRMYVCTYVRTYVRGITGANRVKRAYS